MCAGRGRGGVGKSSQHSEGWGIAIHGGGGRRGDGILKVVVCGRRDILQKEGSDYLFMLCDGGKHSGKKIVSLPPSVPWQMILGCACKASTMNYRTVSSRERYLSCSCAFRQKPGIEHRWLMMPKAFCSAPSDRQIANNKDFCSVVMISHSRPVSSLKRNAVQQIRCSEVINCT